MADGQTRADRNALEAAGFAWADRILRAKEQLFPFAFTIQSDGAVQQTATLSVDPSVNAPELVALLRRQHREAAERREIRASAVGYDASVGGGRAAQDAVAIAIECVGAQPYTVFRPYRRGLLGRLSYDDGGGFRQDHRPAVFPRSSEPEPG